MSIAQRSLDPTFASSGEMRNDSGSRKVLGGSSQSNIFMDPAEAAEELEIQSQVLQRSSLDCSVLALLARDLVELSMLGGWQDHYVQATYQDQIRRRRRVKRSPFSPEDNREITLMVSDSFVVNDDEGALDPSLIFFATDFYAVLFFFRKDRKVARFCFFAFFHF